MSWGWYFIISWPFGYLLCMRELLRAQALENYKNDKGYALSKRSGDKGFAIGSAFLWPLVLPVAIILSIVFSSQIKDNGEYGSKLLPKPPRSVRRQIEAKEHEERCKELELLP